MTSFPIMPPDLGQQEDNEWPLYTRMYHEQRPCFTEKVIWVLDGVENFNYVTRLKHGFGYAGLTTDREADNRIMAYQAQRIYRRFCAEIEAHLTLGVRHYEVANEGTDEAYVVQFAGGIGDPQIPELTPETAQLRLLREPVLIPQRAAIDSDLPETQAFSIAFTLTPTLGRELDYAELIR